MKKRVVALLLAMMFVVIALASCGAKSALNETYVLDKVTVSLTKEGKENLEKANITKDDLADTLKKAGVQEIKFDDNLFEADGSTLKGKLTKTEYKVSVFGKVTLTVEDKDYGTVKYIYKKK